MNADVMDDPVGQPHQHNTRTHQHSEQSLSYMTLKRWSFSRACPDGGKLAHCSPHSQQEGAVWL